MRAYASSRNASNPNGEFHSFHVRRGDFQYKDTRIEAEEIYNNVRDVLPEGSAVFIATDERNKAFFNVLKQHYDIKFLDDFINELNPPGFPTINTNYYGMIDQLVVSRITFSIRLRARILKEILCFFRRRHLVANCSSAVGIVPSPDLLIEYEDITL
jgi:GDP-fucose protein O-fucosyltransferase